MPYIRTIPDEAATGALAQEYAAALARAGRVFHIVRLHSLDVATLKAMLAMYQATLVTPRAPLPRATREMIAVVVSRANDCFY